LSQTANFILITLFCQRFIALPSDRRRDARAVCIRRRVPWWVIAAPPQAAASTGLRHSLCGVGSVAPLRANGMIPALSWLRGDERFWLNAAVDNFSMPG